MLIFFLKIGLISSNLFHSRNTRIKAKFHNIRINHLWKKKLKLKKKMNELLEGTNIEKAIHLVRVCKVTAYKASKLYGVKSGTLSAHLMWEV